MLGTAFAAFAFGTALGGGIEDGIGTLLTPKADATTGPDVTGMSGACVKISMGAGVGARTTVGGAGAGGGPWLN